MNSWATGPTTAMQIRVPTPTTPPSRKPARAKSRSTPNGQSNPIAEKGKTELEISVQSYIILKTETLQGSKLGSRLETQI